ncbi:MAG: DUF1015 family protein, partial [Cytophagaceae bacterium]
MDISENRENKSSILPHENVIDDYVKEKCDTLLNLKVDTSPTMGIYEDPEHFIEQLLDSYSKNPAYIIKNQEEEIQFFLCSNKEDIGRISNFLKNKNILLADGHHRFAALSSLYKKALKEGGNARPYQYQTMLLTNAASENSLIYPIHRGIADMEDFNEKDVLTEMEKHFEIKTSTLEDIQDIISTQRRKTFGLLLPSGIYEVRLKSGKEKDITWNFPESIKDLDLTILHYYIIEKAL